MVFDFAKDDFEVMRYIIRTFASNEAGSSFERPKVFIM